MIASIEAFLAYLRDHRKASQNTVLAYRSDLLQLVEWLQAPPEKHLEQYRISGWSDLTGAHLEAYVADLDAYEYVRSTIARKVAALRIFVQWLREQGEIEFDGVPHLRPPSVPRSNPKVLTQDQVKELLVSTTRDSTRKPEALRDRAMMVLLYTTGMRASELLSLNVADFSADHRSVDVRAGVDQSRTLDLTDEARSALSTYLKNGRPLLESSTGKRTDALFLNHRGARLTRQGLWLLFKRYGDRTGIDTFSPHILRHSFAVHALEGGVPIADVQIALGHVSRSTTAGYQRSDSSGSAES